MPQSFYSADRARLNGIAYLFLAALCLAFFIPGFATLPPVDRDETSFAQASKQMIETGNYVDIRLQDKPRYKKPIGIYWLQTASVRLFNSRHLSEIWAYRLPSLLGATLAVLLTAALGSLLFGPETGLIAAMMMASCIVLNAEARLAKTDAALLATIMLAQYSLAKAYIGSQPHPRLNAFWFWTALGAGILIKGPIILLVVISTMLWLRTTRKDLGWIRRLYPLAGIGYCLLLIAPWFISILMQSHGAFLQDSAGQDMLAKIWHGHEQRGILPPGLHLLALPVVFFPFSLLVILAIPDAWKNRADKSVAFCLGWIIPTWIVFELSLTKLPHYVLPTYPALAILAAKVFIDGYPHLLAMKSRWFLTLTATIWMLVGAVIVTAFLFLSYILDHRWLMAQAIAGLLLVMTQGLALVMLAQRKSSTIPLLAFGQMLFIACVFGLTLPQIEHLWPTREAYALVMANKPCAKTALVSSSYDEPGLVFTAGTDTRLVTDATAAAAWLRQTPCSLALIDHEHQPAFLSAFPVSGPQPEKHGEVTGYNIGHGTMADLILYHMPTR